MKKKQKQIAVEQADDSSYYEEELVSDPEGESVEEVDENGFPIIRSSASGDFVDDDSSTPPPSLEGGAAGKNWHESFTSFDLVADVAAQEGARKASVEAKARQEYFQRKAAREALQKRRREQEGGTGPTDYSVTSIEDPAMQILMDRLEEVEVSMAQSSPGGSSSKSKVQVLNGGALEKRKQALMELRRLVVRDQLARNVNELKSVNPASTT